jgi:hypothetical protein
MTYATSVLDASTWVGFADLVERNNGIFGGCWCIGFHLERKQYGDARQAKEQRVRTDRDLGTTPARHSGSSGRRRRLDGRRCRHCPCRSRRSIQRVAAVGSTPNWERPGMRSLTDPAEVLDQGEADPYSAWLAAHLDPARHLDQYLHGISIAFELGAEDHHIPASNAQDFRRALTDRDPIVGDRMRITVRDGWITMASPPTSGPSKQRSSG